MLPRIKINDISFFPDRSTSKYFTPKRLEWYRGPNETSKDNNLIFYTDDCLSAVDLSSHKSTKIALLIEPLAIRQDTYKYILDNYHKFNLVLSHHMDIIKNIPNGVWYPNGMSWVAEADWKTYNKTKNISIVASEKNYTVGHRLRHDIINHYMHISTDSLPFSLYGRGYKPIEHKIEALAEYRFSLAIENSQAKYYFTEKLIDCFATHTVPIYWGCPDIDKFFNINGMFVFNSIEDLSSIINDISLYGDVIYNSEKFQEAIKENFELAKQYQVAEDYIYDNILIPKGLI